METMNITTARKRLYKLVDDVNQTHAPVLLTGKEGNAVLVSAEDWHAIEETLFLNNIPGMAESIRAAHDEPEADAAELKDVDWD